MSVVLTTERPNIVNQAGIQKFDDLLIELVRYFQSEVPSDEVVARIFPAVQEEDRSEPVRMLLYPAPLTHRSAMINYNAWIAHIERCGFQALFTEMSDGGYALLVA